MESLPLKNHLACQSLQRFMIESLELRAERNFTCLVKDCDMLCQRYPDIAPQILDLYARAEELGQTLILSTQNAESPRERMVCSDIDEHARLERSEAPPALDSGAAVVEKVDTSLVSAVEHMDLPEVNYSQSKDVKAANDEETPRCIEADRELDNANPFRNFLSPMTAYTNLPYETGGHSPFNREARPQRPINQSRRTLMQAIEYTSVAHDHRSPRIDFALSFSEEQGAR
jgi:hypothetical protein